MQESVCELHFRGNGFLYNMVRILTGTLIEVGLIADTNQWRRRFPVTERWQVYGAAEGLFLERVEYE